MLLHLFIKLVLQSAHPNLDDFLDLIWQFALYVLLESPQQKGSEHLMQTSNNQQRLFFVQLDLISCARIGKRSVEPFVKRFDGVEDLGKDEIKERP
jgi:hypothetical protein